MPVLSPSTNILLYIYYILSSGLTLGGSRLGWSSGRIAVFNILFPPDYYWLANIMGGVAILHFKRWGHETYRP